MIRLATVLIAIATLTGCGETIEEYELSSASVNRFMENAESLSARDDQNSPLAMSVLASNQVGAPESVQIWNPDETLKSVGLKNGDLIALIDGKVPSREYKSSFAANQKPFASATEQYVHFVSELLTLSDSQASVLLAVHTRYATRAERDKYGAIHSTDPHFIRIVFR